MNRSDYHKILGVSPNASEQEIKSAYRRLAREHHPDVNPDDHEAEERFKQINEAYMALSDGSPRDGDGDPASRSPWTSSPPEPDSYFSWANAQDAAWAAQNSDMGFAELFQSVHGGGQVHMSPFPDMDDAFARWQTSVEREVPEIEVTLEEAFSGTKRYSSDGAVLEIPPGVFDGASVATPDGHSARIRLLPHAVFQSNGLDLYCEIAIHPHDEEIGIPLTLPTLHGDAAIELPPGVPHDEFLRLEGLGLPGTFSGSPPGHLFLHVIHDPSLPEGTAGKVHPYTWGT